MPANKKIDSKYDKETEKEVVDWINALTGEKVPYGKDNFHAAVKDGRILLEVVNKIYSNTPEKPEKAKKLAIPAKYNKMSASFKQMENHQIFLNYCEAYGVPKESLFQTVDVYENLNFGLLLNTCLQLGTECQRHSFNGPCIGPKPTSQNIREFSEEVLNASKSHIGLQAGTNKCASQSGMSSGGPRHIADIKVAEMDKASQGHIGLQAGSNKGASQSGMSSGGPRHIADIKVAEMDKASQGHIGLQAGSNKGASQSGMSSGGPRHIADIKVAEMDKASQGYIGLQAGSNQGASQAGMSSGGPRHIADIKVAEMDKASQGHIGLQAGSNQGASQAGMSSGGPRHIADIKVDKMDKASEGIIGLQAGSNQGDSQSGMSFGAQRKILDSH